MDFAVSTAERMGKTYSDGLIRTRLVTAAAADTSVCMSYV